LTLKKRMINYLLMLFRILYLILIKNALGQLMQSVMESSEKNLESISNKITKNLIPALNKATFEENTLV
jgi:hypothetical protein